MDAETNVDRADAEHPVVCTLAAEPAAKQIRRWQDLQDGPTTVAAVEGGARLTMPSSLVGDVERLVEQETACCSFLTITTSVFNDELTVEITSTNPDAFAVISALAGVPLP